MGVGVMGMQRLFGYDGVSEVCGLRVTESLHRALGLRL